jgi:hypothetical protein
VKTDGGNSDSHPDDPDKIHWGKYDVMGKIIAMLSQCQATCRETEKYNFPHRLHIWSLVVGNTVMDHQVWRLPLSLCRSLNAFHALDAG